jgi:hypothetical protein
VCCYINRLCLDDNFEARIKTTTCVSQEGSCRHESILKGESGLITCIWKLPSYRWDLKAKEMSLSVLWFYNRIPETK